MAGESHFEIYPERHVNDSFAVQEGSAVAGEPTGNYRWRFQYANGDIGPVSGQGYGSRTDANRSIHDFMSAINREHPHPPIIDVEE